MISLPDELLQRIDARARTQHMTRSGLLRTLAERDLADEGPQRAQAVDRLLGLRAAHDGAATNAIREARERV